MSASEAEKPKVSVEDVGGQKPTKEIKNESPFGQREGEKNLRDDNAWEKGTGPIAICPAHEPRPRQRCNCVLI